MQRKRHRWKLQLYDSHNGDIHMSVQARIKNDLRRIRAKIDATRNPHKKAKMIKAYVRLLETIETR